MPTFAILGLVACLGSGEGFRPVPGDVPAVYHIGELSPVAPADLADVVDDPASYSDFVHYGQLGADEDAGVLGGATFEFAGTGGSLCVLIDPEAVYWNYTVEANADRKFKYEDIYQDDGDLDLDVGLTAYYTGSPGVEIGDFNAIYTDPAGVDHTLAFNECGQTNIFGVTGIHAGRGTVEYCEIDTSARAGTMFTGLISTFALPLDDSVVNFGAVVIEGSCAEIGTAEAIGPSECILPNEVGLAEPDGIPENKSWYPELESEFCVGPGRTNSYCSDHAGDDSPPCREVE